MQSRGFWSDHRVLITGGAGFIGSHLAETLLALGANVTIIDDLSTGHFQNIAGLVGNPRFRFAIDTILNEAVLDRLAAESDAVFHLAAAVGVKLIVERPVQTIETNVFGTEAVLRAAQRYRAKVILASTSEVYGKGDGVPFAEENDVVLGPTCRRRWAYAASKMVDEFLCLAYHTEKGLPVVIARLFNTVGVRQTGRYGMVLPRLVSQALAGEPLTVYGDGSQSRCFMHVNDAVSGMLAVAADEAALGGVYNIGSTEETPILALARLIVKTTESTSDIVLVPYDEAYAPGFEDMRRRVPDTTKILSLTGWRPRHTLVDIVWDVVNEKRVHPKEGVAD